MNADAPKAEVSPNSRLVALPQVLHVPALGTEMSVAASLGSFWRDLVAGSWIVSQQFFTDTRCGLTFVKVGSPSGLALFGRRLEIVERLLCGADQNRIAVELALAPSTIACEARKGLEAIGAHGRPSRVHPLVMMLATAAHGKDERLIARLQQFQEDGQETRIVDIPRPEQSLDGIVSTAEIDVVSQLVEGWPHANIASRRGTSRRTIANQVSAVFQRLLVSGRNELLHKLFELAGLKPETPSRLLGRMSTSASVRPARTRTAAPFPCSEHAGRSTV